MNLPKDPYMLLSIINMRLRDSDNSFEEICCCADGNCTLIQEALRQIGYIYDPECNQFVRRDI